MSFISTNMIRQRRDFGSNSLSVIVSCKETGLNSSNIIFCISRENLFSKDVFSCLLILECFTSQIISVIRINCILLNDIKSWTHNVINKKISDLSCTIWTLISWICDSVSSPNWNLLISCCCSWENLFYEWCLTISVSKFASWSCTDHSGTSLNLNWYGKTPTLKFIICSRCLTWKSILSRAVS